MANKILRALLLAFFCALLALAGGCAEKRNSAVGYYFDTVVTLSGDCSEAVLRDALKECARYEALLSKTRKGSDVWRINHGEGAPVSVSADTVAVLTLAQDVSQKSGGAFDVTIAPASALWDFAAQNPTLPDADALARAAKLVDYTQLTIENGQVCVPPGHSVDLGGVAKGYIADKIADYLAKRGVESALIDFGGNVKALGGKARGTPWSIGIQDPKEYSGVSFAALDMPPGWSLVTSGTYERGFTLDGMCYHHILDTATGWPVQNGLAGVTILAESSMLADALSTACFALGVEEGMALADAHGAQALFITDAGEMICTQEMEALLRFG